MAMSAAMAAIHAALLAGGGSMHHHAAGAGVAAAAGAGHDRTMLALIAVELGCLAAAACVSRHARRIAQP
ncbi:hypothetical protein [Specibacter cremeus]|uniref:hypothetical protein n=1 Tax=Specibacter cremeus TaxID=1629051 RepID=UPI001F0C8FC2|nr:hypothetical protein [Specibacter cremeus]